MNTTTQPHLQPQADETGARRFNAHLGLDKQGTGMLVAWLNSVLDTTIRLVTSREVQCRGIDLSVRLNNVKNPETGQTSKAVGIDVKADNNVSGNISLELISQDRPNSVHAEPVVGWTGKDMSLVAQLFVQTGDLVIINMAQFYPWLYAQLQSMIKTNSATIDVDRAWFSATPNATYQSYNIIVPIESLLNSAPGCIFIPAFEVLSDATLLKSGAPYELKASMLSNYSYDKAEAMATLRNWLSTLEGYHIKTQLSAEDKERLLRLLETKVKFSNKSPQVLQKGMELITSRPRAKLPEDTN